METPEDRRLRAMSRMQIGAEERIRRGRDNMAAAAADDPAVFERTLARLVRDAVRASTGQWMFDSRQMRDFGPPKIVTLGTYPDTRLAAVFRHTTERGHWVGWSGAIWVPEIFTDFGVDPEGHVIIHLSGLGESMDAVGYGPPRRFLPGRITWIGFQPVSLAEAARFASFPLFVPMQEPPGTERSIWITLGTVGGYQQEAVCIEWRGEDQPHFTLVEGLVPDLWRARATWDPDPEGRELMVPTTNPFGPLVPMVALTARGGTLIWVDSSLDLDAVAEILQSLERVPGSPDADPATSAS